MAKKALNLLKYTAQAVQTLSIYGACGIVAFGWVLSRILHFSCQTYALLWFSAAIFIYNLDRLKADPADALNIPRRNLKTAKLRKISIAITVLAGLTLVLLPILQHDWLMAILTVCGGIFCMNYSVALLGFRFKDVPLIKTLFAPTIVTAALLIPPFLQQRAGYAAIHYATAAAWTWCVLMFNMILCDLRDIKGDSAMGTRSLPVALGAQSTIYALGGLLALIAALSVAGVFQSTPRNVTLWKLMGAGTVLYLAALLAIARRQEPLPEFFYEWWVEGILYLPVLVYPFAR